jgi:hypothetical protein
VYWQNAVVHIKDNGGQTADLQGVHGSLFQKLQEASQFRASNGTSDQTGGLLTMSGHVILTSLVNKASLRCDRVQYSSKGQRIVKATGNVQVQGEWGTVSGLQEVWSTPDLKTFGTPDLFQRK